MMEFVQECHTFLGTSNHNYLPLLISDFIFHTDDKLQFLFKRRTITDHWWTSSHGNFVPLSTLWKRLSLYTHHKVVGQAISCWGNMTITSRLKHKHFCKPSNIYAMQFIIYHRQVRQKVDICSKIKKKCNLDRVTSKYPFMQIYIFCTLHSLDQFLSFWFYAKTDHLFESHLTRSQMVRYQLVKVGNESHAVFTKKIQNHFHTRECQ